MKANQMKFYQRLGMLAKSCDYALTDDWLALYDRALRRFGYERATEAVEAAIIERRGNERMPSIGDLVARCSPQIQERDTAVEAAGRIVAAVPKFGRYAHDADVRDWVGPVAWHVIEQNGGWKNFCGTYGNVTDPREVANWKAQLRDQAVAAVRREKAGLLNTAPRFGEVANIGVQALIGQVLKKSEVSDGSSRNARAVPRQCGSGELDAEGNSGVTEAL